MRIPLGRETSFAHIRYTCQILNIEYIPSVEDKSELEMPEAIIDFFKKDIVGIHPYNDDPMVIDVKWEEWEIKRVLLDQGSSTNIPYWDAFERLCLDLEDLKHLKGSMVGFLGEHVQANGYLTLRITFGEHDQAK